MSSPALMRIAKRKVKPGCGPAYEELVRAMFEDARNFPGYLGAELIPPAKGSQEYQVVMKFASESELETWNRSRERRLWHDRLRPIAEGDPEFRVLTGLEAWFTPPEIPGGVPSRRRMAVVTWLGIYPTVSLLLWALGPILEPAPYLIRTAIFTALIVVLMTWGVMPRLTRALAGWINPHRRD